MSMNLHEDGRPSYEQLRQLASDLPPAMKDGGRSLSWANGSRSLGLARDFWGRLELFLPGPPLRAQSALVRNHLDHDRWRRDGGELLVGSRLRLPSAAHFDAVAAFLCVELLNNGVALDAVAAFRRTEAVIEMALRRMNLQTEAIVGLVGELVLLGALVDRAAVTDVHVVVESWRGHLRAARDFQLGPVGVEVKTTRHPTDSVHHVQGTRQVEIGHSADGGVETRFYLISMGVEEVDPDEPEGTGSSVSSLVEDLIGAIERKHPEGPGELVSSLLTRIKAYGVGDGDGYDHADMAHRAAFTQRWRTAFVRSYDMTDPAILLLRRGDLVPFTMVDAESVEYTLRLPSKVSGDVNPVRGLMATVDALLIRE